MENAKAASCIRGPMFDGTWRRPSKVECFTIAWCSINSRQNMRAQVTTAALLFLPLIAGAQIRKEIKPK